MRAVTERIDFGPWNPGIQSQLPAAVLPLATAFSSKNVFTTIAEAHERSAFTGLDCEDLVAFRPERLVVHELLIRVMGDVSVPDGREYADLGVNFRKIAETIYRSHIDPHMAEIVDAGAQRVSVGGALAWTAVNAFASAATQIRLIPAASMIWRKAAQYFPSRSWIRYCPGARKPHVSMVTLRAICIIHCS